MWEYAEFDLGVDGYSQHLAAGWELVGLRVLRRRRGSYRTAVMRRRVAVSIAPDPAVRPTKH